MSVDDLAAHHLIKRRYRKTRWMLEAAVSVDFVCHEYLEKHPDEDEAFAMSILGTSRYAELQAIARDVTTKVDLDEVIESLREQVAA